MLILNSIFNENHLFSAYYKNDVISSGVEGCFCSQKLSFQTCFDFAQHDGGLTLRATSTSE